MSLYDMMNARVYARKPDKRGGMMDARVGDVSVPAESPLPPAPKTYAVKNSEAIASVAAPVQEAPQAVQSTKTPQKKPYTHWWQTPEYLGEVNRRAADAEKRAEQDRKRAVRQRNAAILGDLAKLGAQMYAKNGGAWKIDAFTPATEKANDKLAALRERHAAEVAAFAKERAAARQAIAADNNARMKLETSLAEADAERKRRAATEKTNQDYRERTLENEKERIEIAKQNAKTAAQNAAVGRASGGSGVNRDVFIVKDDGTKEYFRHADNANNVQDAYARLPKEYRVMKRVEKKIYGGGIGEYEWIEDTEATIEQKRQAISDYNNRELVEDWTPEEDEIIDYEP